MGKRVQRPCPFPCGGGVRVNVVGARARGVLHPGMYALLQRTSMNIEQ